MDHAYGPMMESKSFAKKMPAMANGIEHKTLRKIDCTAAVPASSIFFSPTLRAMIAVTAVASPIASEYNKNKYVSVRPTVATAEGPSLPTKKMSTTAKVDSITNSKIMGTANRKMALLRSIFV